jgi:hypothetical protein
VKKRVFSRRAVSRASDTLAERLIELMRQRHPGLAVNSPEFIQKCREWVEESVSDPNVTADARRATIFRNNIAKDPS